jgi:nucleoside 2-deoxyribosyltransferase
MDPNSSCNYDVLPKKGQTTSNQKEVHPWNQTLMQTLLQQLETTDILIILLKDALSSF